MNTARDLIENTRRQMGYIKIYNKSYPIYEGLNIIGRDLKATVRVTDLKFSKQHAVLSVVDENTHFISDFGSSNGTEVRRNKLTPFKFYKIKDREPVIFGDVVGVFYTSVEATQKEADAAAPQSQIIDHMASTQLITENIHELPTQPFDKDTTQSIHETTTQEIIKTASTTHDLSTQVLTETPEVPELPGCSKSAAIITIDDDLALSRTETYDDVFANDSFRLSLQNNTSKYDIVVDETLPTDNSIMNKNNNVSIEDDDIILSTQDNEMIEKQTVVELLKTNKKVDDSDSETDIEDEEEFKKKIQEKSTQLNDSKKIAEINNQNDSDSETDAEEDLLSRKNQQEPTDNDSDTEIEDNVLANLPSSRTNESSPEIEDIKPSADNKSKPTTVVFSDEEEELDLLAPTQLLQTKSNENKVSDDLPATTDNKIQELDDDDDLLLVPTQLLESKKTENSLNDTQDDDIDLLGSKRNENTKEQDENVDDDILAPTQLLQSKTDVNKEPEDENDDDDSNLLAPTQLLQNKTDAIKEPEDKNDDDADSDLLAPTQLLQSKTDANKEPEDENDDDADSDLLAPTQLLQSKKDENNREQGQIQDKDNDDDGDNLPPTQLLQSKTDKHKNPEVEDEDESDLLPPTQLLESKKSANNKEQVQVLDKNDDDDDDLPPTQLLQNINKKDDSIFTAPTQILEKNSPKRSSILSTKSPRNKQKRSVNFSEDIIYDMPTQKLDKTDQNNQKNDIFEAPTQLLNKTDDDIYSAETQPLPKSVHDQNDSCSSINNLNNTRESVENSSLRLVLSEVDDDSICESSKKNSNNSTTAPPPEPETQLEVDFALETQKLYLEDKTSRPDNPLAHMFAEEPTQMTEELTELKSDKKVVKNEKIIDIEKSRYLQVQLQDIKDISKACTSKTSSISEESLKRGRKKKNDVETVAENAPKLKITAEVENSDDTKDVPEASTSKTHSSTSDENDFKQEPLKRGRRKKNIDIIAENAPKLNVTIVKNTEDTKNNNKVQKTDDSLIKSSETDEDKPHNTRGKRVSYQKLNSGGKNTSETKKPPTRGKSLKEVEVDQPRKSLRPQPRDKLKTIKKEIKVLDKNDNSSDMDDFINRVTRSSKRTHSVSSTPKKKPKQEEENLQIEDSEEEMPIPLKKKTLKLQYTDDSEITTSNSNSTNSTVVRNIKPSKRSMKIEDYSSDENENSNAMSICLNTPNTKRRKFEPLNVTVSSTQVANVPGEPLKHKVVFTMLNDSDLEASVKKLGGSIIDSVQSCTVLVTNKITRSLKFLVAVALGKPIVQSTWITDSMKKKSFQDPWNYLLEDKESESKFNFTLKESLLKSVEKKLLADVVVLLATKKNTDVLKELIETSGGKCIQRAPGKNGTAIVISYEEEKAKYSKYLKQKSLTVVSAEAIFSGVLQQEIQWKQHLLS